MLRIVSVQILEKLIQRIRVQFTSPSAFGAQRLYPQRRNHSVFKFIDKLERLRLIKGAIPSFVRQRLEDLLRSEYFGVIGHDIHSLLIRLHQIEMKAVHHDLCSNIEILGMEPIVLFLLISHLDPFQ